MAAQQSMSEHSNRSTPILRGQERVPTCRQYYPPPPNINEYVSRTLPQLPRPRPPSSPSSLYGHEEDYANLRTPRYLLTANNMTDSRRGTAFAGAIDENALDMVRPPQIIIPSHPRADDHPDVVSPQPQRPDSKLLSMWANGDELVSPIDTPGTASWKSHVVSPLSEDSEAGQASWFDDTSSDEDERPDPSNETQKKDLFTNHRYSDPGSPSNSGFDMRGFGEPGPDVGGFQRFGIASGRQTVQPQMYYSSNEQGHCQDSNADMGESKISFSVPKIDAFSSDRPGAGQRPVPPPLRLGQESVQEDYVKTPFPPRPDSVSSERNAPRPDEQSPKQQKRRSGLGSFDSLRRSSTQNIRKAPPGFTEILSQLDNHGVVSTTPRSRGLLSKAKHGLGIGSDESKREKARGT
ncbi:hypothetical protein GQX73_g5319 [Xylaria multiplex]|uniref:Uncharacterized protein n=1 Tax=Xylaria multiplex TaxID=323545 RepID=A0A7C8J0W8_9PEZI|nr:hypothetical protein GQX73_g5319 [Xylaria multiplex]